MGNACGINSDSTSAVNVPKRLHSVSISGYSGKSTVNSSGEASLDQSPAIACDAVANNSKVIKLGDVKLTLCKLNLDDNLYAIAPQDFGKRCFDKLNSDYNLSANDRWNNWKSALNISKYSSTVDYNKLKVQKLNLKYADTIHNDVLRTFPNFAFNYQSLENILTAYTVHSGNVGYCQGMNYLAAFLLIVSNSHEEEAFLAFFSLMQTPLSSKQLPLPAFSQAFVHGFPLIGLLENLLNRVLASRSLALKEHLSSVGLCTDLWFHKWVSSLFLYTFPLPFCAHLWDAILRKGLHFVLAIVCAMVDKLSARLMKAKSMEEYYEVFKAAEKLISDPVEIVREAESININWESLKKTMPELTIKECAEVKDTPKIIDKSKINFIRQNRVSERVQTKLLRRFTSDNSKSNSHALPPINRSKRVSFEYNNELLSSTTISNRKNPTGHIRARSKVSARIIIKNAESVERRFCAIKNRKERVSNYNILRDIRVALE
eukprot:TRINITY_DN14988_c0_g1_i4.p1 TRINITY_DN14988_c0_g1~~TRINITY_DN14988_c0_g1_i4.p1  ORF type:complete len:489 (+),score=18.20 TRINITY_DN14988_c0_g1_i4:149-1615(+)